MNRNVRGWRYRVVQIGPMAREDEIRKKWNAIAHSLNERDARLWGAAEANVIGSGGVAIVARATGMSRSRIHRGIVQLQAESHDSQAPRQRRVGAGRKQNIIAQPKLLMALNALVDPDTRGDPESPLRWCSKSTSKLATTLRKQGYNISARTVATLLWDAGYTLQRTRKTREGTDHPDRDAQFHRINELVKSYQADAQPVVSVDTKKKEKIGNFSNGGNEWQPQGHPEQTRMHDFVDEDLGKAIPYGVYDVATNEGFVNVGVTHDTPVFAVAVLRRWWDEIGRPTYPNASKLLITADCGGSNGYRVRAWKAELQRLATQTGLAIRVAHFPPGTSKWNKIEHRLFCHITHNWRGRPLVSRQVVVNLIGSTTTQAGLRVKAALDEGDYKTGLGVSDQEFAALAIERDDFHGDWNYTLCPQKNGLR